VYSAATSPRFWNATTRNWGRGHFYRTSAGAEIDLLLHLPGVES
jgi:hypothetical protein